MRPLLLRLAIVLSVVPLAACSDGSPASGAVSSASKPPVASTPRSANAPTLSADDQVKLVAWFEEGRHKQGMGVLDRNLGRFKRSVAIDPSTPADFRNVHSACRDLDHDLNIIKDFEPIPDPPTQALWSSALMNLRQGATQCLTGSTANDATQVTKAKTALMKGDTDYSAVVARLGKALGVTPTPTSS
ncbi:hypothetical protein [Streptomyces albipurpureus]|uniref:Lipoprotein n=1 Tax=Streptomyces albipurpureus TaxID=2897419 RepID=A0ABT0UVY4_9ACTN|nr:hypothetical protein [Streptomyces sp. CWNU-1]MCM2392743.1 hypothetical protein [Streptomyces sp. CWNU-1]